MSNIITKQYQAKASIDENFIEGAASVVGNIDRYGDVIMPGAFAQCLGAFKARGFVPTDHSWEMDDIVAMPIECMESGSQLTLKAEFHSDPNSQAVRTKCMERIQRGLSVGLSIGFSIPPQGRMWFETGAKLLAWAGEQGYDLSLLSPELQGYGECFAIPVIKELYEVSIVPVPANTEATITIAKSLSDKAQLEGLTLSDHLDTVLAAVQDASDRANALDATRKSEGRKGLVARQDQIKALIQSLETLVIDDAPTQEQLEKAEKRKEWLLKRGL